MSEDRYRPGRWGLHKRRSCGCGGSLPVQTRPVFNYVFFFSLNKNQLNLAEAHLFLFLDKTEAHLFFVFLISSYFLMMESQFRNDLFPVFLFRPFFKSHV